MSIIGILIFVFGLLLTVALHELGHLIPAKKFGVKVSQYFVGFGPTIFSRVYRGTEYGVKWILLGGYVRLCGMLAPAKPGTKTHTKDGKLTIAEQARRASAAELADEQSQKAFWQLSPGKKIVVMFGGPAVNLLLAVFCFAIVWLGIGMPNLSNKVGKITPCLDLKASTCALPEATPAVKAKLFPADEIISWDGQKIANWEQLQTAIKSHGTGLKNIEVIRAGKTEKMQIDVVEIARPQLKNGQIVRDAQGEVIQTSQPFVGIAPQVVRTRQSIFELPVQIGNLALGTAKIIVSLPAQLWNIGVSIVTDTSRDASGVVGLVGIADMAGKITSTAAADYSFAARAADMFLLFASLNMSLFVFNLLPLLPLDGGHILGAIIEWLQRIKARRRGEEMPTAFDTARLIPLSQFVIFCFVAMTFFLIVADILKPVV